MSGSESAAPLGWPSGSFSVIYADPPWRYDFSKSKSRDVENQYPTMTTEDVCALQVPAAADAVLYLWATAPKLEDALRVVKAWGFTYKTHAVWDKELIGMGYWFRGQHELLIVATRGRVSPPPQGLRCGSVLRFRRGRHSAKPGQVRDMIAAWFPSARRLEMFAREQVECWTVWGNEVQANTRNKGVKECASSST